MGGSQCPVCFTTLEARDVTPCSICGARTTEVGKLEPEEEYRAWRLPDGQVLVLCRGCELEEFMVPGGWGYRLGLANRRLPIDDLQFVRSWPEPRVMKDKVCPQCNLKLAFLEIVASHAHR